MTTFNTDWLQENFSAEHNVIFDIGCADLHDSVNLLDKTNGQVFAFECNPVWKEKNLERAKKLDRLNYFHCGISNVDGTENFVPSHSLKGQEWNWSGSLCPPTDNLKTDEWKWKDPVSVTVRSIDSICLEHQLVPNFIHIDAQGAEYKIFKDMVARPFAIWCEVSEFENYETGITEKDFHTMMFSKGYNLKHTQDENVLYVLKNTNLTNYG